MTVIGAFAFGDFVYETWNCVGLAMSMGGAVWYAMRSALKVRARQAAAGASAPGGRRQPGACAAAWFARDRRAGGQTAGRRALCLRRRGKSR